MNRPPDAASHPASLAPVFIAVAFGTSALFAAMALSPILAVRIGGSSAWTGAPGAAAIFGTGVGSLIVSRLTVAFGRKPALIMGWAVGAIGALCAAAGVYIGSIWLLIGGMLIFGAGNAANGLSRYAAAELVPAATRGRAIGLVVWASVIGGVAGPAIVASLGQPPAHDTVGAGGFGYLGLVGAASCYIAAAIVLTLFYRPAPSAEHGIQDDAAADLRSLRSLLHLPRVRLALVALVVSQVVMVLVMTVTPVHISADGSHLQTVTLVMGGHFVGMFILAPLVGVIVDRFGPSPVISTGLLTLMLSALIAALAAGSTPVYLSPALILIGVGWSLCFVAASGALARGLSWPESVKVQGGVDAVVWTISASASLLAGLLLAFSGYAALALAAALLVPAPAIWLYLRRNGLMDDIPG